ncbi:MAG: hypothetical protein KJ061_09295 [Vicinamibacteraceae bacterium]|nr:hypothetical protein [Vicinamibacteraceae bacterium]
MTYDITVLKVGQCEVPGPEVYWMSHWDTWEQLYFWLVVIQGGGKTAIVNTGPPVDLRPMNEVWAKAIAPRSQMLVQPGERPEEVLSTIGLKPADVDYVLITPLQAYATGNIPLFTNAQVCISRRGWIEDFHAPRFEMMIPRKLRIPDDVLVYLDVTAPEKVRLLDDEDEILPGLRAMWTGVHHRSSMTYLVDTADGTVAISDSYFKLRNIEEDVPLGITESMEECHVSYGRVRKAASRFLPLYEPLVGERFPQRRAR